MNTHPVPILTEEQTIRFSKYVEMPTPRNMMSQCWLWTGVTNQWGYGRFYVNGKTYLAHRLSAVNYHGEQTEVVRHRATCPKNCVNPYHLSLGTQAENVQDRVDAGEYTKGGTHVTDEERDEIIRLVAEGISRSEIAHMLGRSPNTIRKYAKEMIA